MHDYLSPVPEAAYHLTMIELSLLRSSSRRISSRHEMLALAWTRIDGGAESGWLIVQTLIPSDIPRACECIYNNDYAKCWYSLFPRTTGLPHKSESSSYSL